ncbi:MAG: ATP-binding protein [Myxococcota bacterium]
MGRDVGLIADFFGSSAAWLQLCFGVAAMLGALHLWMARRACDANCWIAVWSVLSCGFVAARGVQLTTADPAAALLAGKLCFATGPFLVWALIGFGRALHPDTASSRSQTWLAVGSVGWAVAILATPWFVSPEVTTRLDFFGREHLSVHARPPALLLGVYIAGAALWGARRLRRHAGLDAGERRVLRVGFVAYAVLGVAAVLTSAGWLRIPAMAEYGPVLVAVCLSYLLVQRQLRVEQRLEAHLDRERHELAASEGRYRDVLFHAPLGVLVCDAEGAIGTLNPQMAQMLETVGAPREGRIFDEPVLVAMGLGDTVSAALESEAPHRVEHRHAAGPRDEAVWQVTAVRLDDAIEGSPGVLVLADDITHRAQLQRQLEQAQKMDSIGQLAAGIAHEINNPMAFVRANLASMRSRSEELHKAAHASHMQHDALCELETLIEESAEGVERTIAIVRDMRDFAHGGAEEAPCCDIAAVLDACVRVAKVSGRGSAEVTTEVTRDLLVEAAAGPMRQVFLNLLVNALQAAGRAGKIWVEAERRGESVRVRVLDDGPGVPPELRPRVFDPFFTTKPVGEGTGLGLYISYQIVASFGGNVGVYARPGGGACFEVELPAAR